MRTWLVPFLMIPLALGCGDKDDDSSTDCDDGFGRAADGNCYPIDDTVGDDDDFGEFVHRDDRGQAEHTGEGERDEHCDQSQ